MEIVTLKERKARAAAAKRAAVDALCAELRAYPRPSGGRFLLYGSAARGELRYDSDVDLLLDFPDEQTTADALSAAEDACGRLGLPNDIQPIAYCSEKFLEHVLPEAIPL